MEPKTEIWIDGACEVCRRSEKWCSTRDLDDRLSFRDLHRSETPLESIGREDLLREVHVVRPDGSVATGYDGWIAILAELPGWSRIAKVAGWSPFRRIGSLIYALIARFRHRISRLLEG